MAYLTLKMLQFTNVVSGSELREGAGLESCTDIIQRSQPFKLDGYNVTIVDTPGFDDTNKSDVEIVNLICGYLREECVFPSSHIRID